MNIKEAIAVLDKERIERGMDMLELLVDIRENRSFYETNTKVIIIVASDVFCNVGREFFADIEETV
jgi:hypothetical protein